MISRREFKLPVTPSTHLLEEYIVNQMKYLDGRLADNIEDHMEKIMKMVNVYQEDFNVWPIVHNINHHKLEYVICWLILSLKNNRNK